MAAVSKMNQDMEPEPGNAGPVQFLSLWCALHSLEAVLGNSLGGAVFCCGFFFVWIFFSPFYYVQLG